MFDVGQPRSIVQLGNWQCELVVEPRENLQTLGHFSVALPEWLMEAGLVPDASAKKLLVYPSQKLVLYPWLPRYTVLTWSLRESDGMTRILPAEGDGLKGKNTGTIVCSPHIYTNLGI